MSPFSIDGSTWWTALTSAFVIGLLLGALPVGVAELIALAVGVIPSMPLRVAVLVLFTAGHVLGKVLWYWIGALGSRITQRHLRVWIERARDLAARHPAMGLSVTAASAALSTPPFHLMAVAAGVVRTPPVPFFAVAFAGRLVRFGVLAAFPALVSYLYPAA